MVMTAVATVLLALWWIVMMAVADWQNRHNR